MRNTRARSLCVSFAGLLALGALLAGPGSAAAQQDSSSGGAAPFDPCQLITAAEASALAGASYVTATHDSSGNMCIYGSQTTNVFTVVAAQASDPDTAQAQWSQYEAKAQNMSLSSVPNGVSLDFNLTDINDLAGADRAAVGQGSASLLGRSISGSAFYLLKGATFVGFTDLQVGSAAPSSDAMEAEAATVLDRLP